jgi:hypothetical protein
MTRTKDRIVDAMNAPNIEAIREHELLGWESRLISAQMAMKGVTKDSRVAFGNQRYAYTSAEDMIGACREALLTAGLALFRSWTIQHSEAGSFVVSDFTLAYPGGSQVVGALVPFPIVSTNGKGEDKAVATALTSSLGYFLRDLLLVPKEDDAGQTVRAPEMDARDDRAVVAKRPTKPAGTLGLAGAAELHQRCTDAGLSIPAMLEAMRAAGLTLDDGPDKWPVDLLPRMHKWIEAKKAN